MKILMSQTQFATLVNANQGTISKYVKSGKLPAEGNKLIMPDAEKVYYLLLGGVTTHLPNGNNTGLSDFISDDFCIDNPQEKINSINISEGYCNYRFEGYNINCEKIFEPSVTISNGNYIAGLDKINDYNTVHIEIRTKHNYGITVVPDDKIDNALIELPGLINEEDENSSYFVISESELFELLKNREQK